MLDINAVVKYNSVWWLKLFGYKNMHKCWTLMWWLSKTVFGGYKYLAIKTCTNAGH